MNPLTFPMPVGRARTRPVPPLGVLGGSKPPCRPVQGFLRVENGCAGPLVSARRSFGAASTNLQALPSRDRHQPQADRSEKPHQAAVPSWPGSSPLPRSVWLGQLSAGNKPPIAAVSLRPKPQEVPPPHSISVCPVVPPWSRLGRSVRLSYGIAAAYLDRVVTEFVAELPFVVSAVGFGIGGLLWRAPNSWARSAGSGLT
jgi:hypothetical protein